MVSDAAVLGTAKRDRIFGVWRGKAKGLAVACDRGIVGSVTFGLLAFGGIIPQRLSWSMFVILCFA